MPKLRGLLGGDVDLPAILRFLRSIDATGRLHFAGTSRKGTSGALFFEQGRIVHASYGSWQGPDALDALALATPGGEFSFADAPLPPERNLDVAPDQALERVEQSVARARRLAPGGPLLSAVPRVAVADEVSPQDWHAAGAARVTLGREALRLIRSLDQKHTLEEMLDSRPPGAVLEALEELVDAQLIRLDEPRGARAPRVPMTLPWVSTRKPDSPPPARPPEVIPAPAERELAADQAEQVEQEQAPRGRAALAFWARPLVLAIIAASLLLVNFVQRSRAPALPQVEADRPVPTVAATSTTSPAVGSGGSLRAVLEERFAGNERGWPHDPQGTAWLPALLPAGVGGAAAGSAEVGYRMHARTPGQFVAVGVPTLGVVRDVLVTATFRKVGGPAGGGYGLILRDQGPFPRDGRSQTGRYYVLEVGDRGEFGIWRRENDRWVDIVPWTASPAVRPGNAPNELAVLATGDRLTFAVNGTPISAADATLPPGGLGVFTGGDGNDVLLLRLAVQTPQ